MNTTMTILLIDDKTSNLFALEQLLEKSDRTFLRASNGMDGLKLALNQNVDLIILDVQMPEMDGFEVAQVLKSNKRTRDIPIIFASAEKKERQSVIQGFDEGAVDYLHKPLDPELTKAKVSVLLKIQLQKRELLEKNQALEKAEAHINQLNTDLRKNLEQLEYANKELESFSYSVSHDLRSPIRSLLGFSSILQEDLKDHPNPEIHSSLEKIKRNADKMNSMIDDLLELSRVGKKELQKSEVNMDEVIKSILTDIPVAEHVSIEINPLDSAPADRALITHVWQNLISNAVKYSSKKDNPRIEIGSDQKDGVVEYYVKDNGAGFNMEYAEKLFGVFQRMHRKSEFEGTGVGLAIVQRIISRHGGKIWAQSKVNEGATFYFILPA